MIKKIFKRIRLNFRKSGSDRKGEASYRTFGRYLKEKYNKYVKINSKNEIKNTKR